MKLWQKKKKSFFARKSRRWMRFNGVNASDAVRSLEANAGKAQTGLPIGTNSSP
jgi:hypothetical protein